MAGLSQKEVEALGRAAGLPLLAEDVPEVTVRINTFIEALAALEGLPLDSVQPLPAPPPPDEAR